MNKKSILARNTNKKKLISAIYLLFKKSKAIRRNHTVSYSIDEIDRQLMRKLQQHARITIVQLSKELHMSAPSIRERILRLEEQGIITGYHAAFDDKQLNLHLTTFMMIKTERCQEVVAFCEQALEVTDLHRISGEYNYLLRIQTTSMEELVHFQENIGRLGVSKSHVSIKNIFEHRYPKF